jgi:mxaD protein
MKTIARALALAATLAAGAAVADNTPWSTLNAYETVSVKRAPDAAWNLVSRWDALESWCPVFEKTEIVSGGTQVGSVRAITLKDGPTFTEELLAVDAARREYTYRIIESPLPIVDYVSTVRVIAMPDGSSEVVWKSSYKRRVQDNPTPEQDDPAVLKLISGVYRACLGNVKAMVERN